MSNDRMIYKVAEAIRTELAKYDVKIICEMAKETGPIDLTPFNLIAVEAVKAMREPTEEMLEACNYEGCLINSDIDLKDRYQDMIDAVLKDFE